MQPGDRSFDASRSRPAGSLRARRAMTLIELLMVLLIMVVAGALVAPNVQNMLRRQRLKSAAETMRIAWSRAHIKAMKTGRIQVFRYEMDGHQYSVQPWVAGDEATEGESEAVSGFGTTLEAPDSTVETKTLEDGIKFAAGEAKFDSRASEVENFLQNGASAEGGGQWSRPILFYPDGSATDAYVIVTDAKQDAYRVNLRGLTGTSQLSEEKKLDDLLAAIQPGEVTP